MFYRKIYPASWLLIKNNVWLLVFGLFASILGFHEVKIFFALSDTSPDFLSSTLTFWLQLFDTLAVADLNWATLPSLLGLVLIFILLVAVLILAVSSQGALIKSAAEKNGRLKNKFSEYLHQGVNKFWPLFGLHLVNIILGYFFVSSVVNPMVQFVAINSDRLQYLLISLLVYFFIFPLIIVISFVTRYGMAYVMIKNQDFLEAFTNSWYLFRINWLITLENSIFIGIITVLYLLAMATAMIFIFTPFFFLSTFLGSLSFTLFTLMVMLGALLALAILVAASALYGAYYNIVWAKVFNELVAPGASHSKIYRLTQKHFPSATR